MTEKKQYKTGFQNKHKSQV